MARRANGEGTVRKRSDGRWEGRYKDPIENSLKSIYGKTQKDVLTDLRRIFNEIFNGEYIKPVEMTVSEWFDIWLEEYTIDIKPLTYASYKGIINKHIRPVLGDFELQKLTPIHIQKLYNRLSNKGMSAKTIQNVHGVIHRALKQAMELNYLRTNVSEACKLPKVRQTEIISLDEMQIQEFCRNMKNDVYSDVFFTALFTGMRQGEILGLTWECVDFINNTIHINKQLLKDVNKPEGEKYCFAPTKNNKTRTIIAPQCVMDILRRRHNMQGQRMRKTILDEYTQKWSNLVFTQDNGKHLTHGTVRMNYKKIVEDLGIPDIRFHDLRHSYAMLSLQNGDDIKTVQGNLGHHSASFTLRTYAYSTKNMQKLCAKRMDDFVKKIAKSKAKYYKNVKKYTFIRGQKIQLWSNCGQAPKEKAPRMAYISHSQGNIMVTREGIEPSLPA